jgi:hypothetical protein
MNPLLKDIEDELKRTRLDKGRLYNLLTKIVENCSGGGAAPAAPVKKVAPVAAPAPTPTPTPVKKADPAPTPAPVKKADPAPTPAPVKKADPAPTPAPVKKAAPKKKAPTTA